MADRAALCDAVWAALTAEDRPVTRERALAAARRVLGPHRTESQHFEEWFAKHGDAVLEKLNG